MKTFRSILLIGLFLALAPVLRAADLLTFDASWTGLNGSQASASAEFVIDAQTWANAVAANTSDLPVADFNSLSISVSGTQGGVGDGTFSIADGDFHDIVVDSNGANFDYTQNLVGQATNGDPYGTPSLGDGGDFNLFTAEGYPGSAPNGVWWFTLGANNELNQGDGADELGLTSLTLVSGTPVPAEAPEPGTLALTSLGCLGLLGLRKRK